MIDLLAVVRHKPEWSLRNPLLSQSCNSQKDEVTMMPTTSGMGPGRPQSPLDAGLVGGFAGLQSDIADNNPLSYTDDELEYFDHNVSALISHDDATDNTVDPDLIFCHERANSANSIVSSPYGELDHLTDASSPYPCSPVVKTPLASVYSAIPSRIANLPEFSRQSSLNVVMEVLASCPTNAQDYYSPNEPFPTTPSPCFNEEYQHLQGPPDCTTGVVPTRSRTMSDFTPFYTSQDENSRPRAFSVDNVDVHNPVGCIHPANISLDFMNSDENIAASCNENAISIIDTWSHTCAPPLESLPSFVKECLENAPGMDRMEEDSLDMQSALEDLIKSNDPSHETKVEETVTAEPRNTDDGYIVSLASAAVQSIPAPLPAAPITSKKKVTPEEIVDLTVDEPCSSKSVPPLKRSASYLRKRSRNNKACRESRKKRKMQQDEAELKIEQLSEENTQLREKIAKLEVEVEETRSCFFRAFSANQKQG